ncbi:hypothetical protein [Metabacillus sp. FJAT-53654]|uniref:Uncharacterized protein n=1 Tax=Metabacillus rhizosphaerae TaxID=3117747 RepID=A0ABZ2N1V3_9BACI
MKISSLFICLRIVDASHVEEGIVEKDLIPSRQWNKPTLFKNVDINKVETFIDVEEVGFTIFSKNCLFN